MILRFRRIGKLFVTGPLLIHAELSCMTDELQIRQFQISDRDALLAFLRTAYPSEPRKSEPGFWGWHFLENPIVEPDDIPLWVVTHGREIVGQLATIPVELKIGDARRRAIWILDFIVHPDHRGKGLGKRLVLAAGKAYPTMLTLGINKQSEAVFRSLKWVGVGNIHRYHKMLFPGNALDGVAANPAVRKLANLIYNPARSRFSHPEGADDGVRRETEFNSSFESLWQRAAPQLRCAVVREPRYLDWQFIKQPGKQFEILGAFNEDLLIGYVVLFFRRPGPSGAPPKAAITDILYDETGSPDVIDRLLRAAIRMAIEKQAGSLVTDVLDEQVERRLETLGFRRIKNSPQFMACAPDASDLLYKPENWFLTRADSDVSIFEEPNR